MRVLWVTAQVLPYVGDKLGTTSFGFGGWIVNMIEQLRKNADLKIGIAMVSDKVKEGVRVIPIDDNLVCYVAHAMPNKSISDVDRNEIIRLFCPQIIHIEGNEFGIQNQFSTIKEIPTLVSLQGLLSGYEPYQYGELPIADNMFSNKNKMMLSSWILYFRKRLKFNKRINIETETLKNAQYLMGRTYWDRAHSYWINSKAKYYACNRILRPVFYNNKWSMSKIERHSIFVGNGYSPLKGLHFAISAVALLKKDYPDVKLYCAGISPIEKNRMSIMFYGYSKIISNLIKKNGLENNVSFVGHLLAEKMVARMLKSHVYVLPSLIENSPNTLGEAMILGMPSISAYAGGSSEMAIDEHDALFYRANDPRLLAWQIKRIFDDNDLAETLSRNAREHALCTHDPEKNKNALVSAYNDILKK